MNDLQRLNMMLPKGAKLDEIITAITDKGGTVAEPKKVDEIASAIENVADWNDTGLLKLEAGNMLLYQAEELPGPENLPIEYYTKIHEVSINANGTIRICFKFVNLYNYADAYGRIYINDNPVGIIRHISYTDRISFTEDFKVRENDKIQVWLKNTRSVRNGGMGSPELVDFEILCEKMFKVTKIS